MNHFSDDDLIDYLHGELPAAVDLRVHEHLTECVPCRARCDAEAAFVEMLRASVIGAEREFPSTIKAHVWEALRNAEPTLLQRIRGFIHPVVAVPLAAAFALLMYFGVPVVHNAGATNPPTVAAAYYLEEHAAQSQENPLADHGSGVSSTFAAERGTTPSVVPLIDAADAATLDDSRVATRE